MLNPKHNGTKVQVIDVHGGKTNRKLEELTKVVQNMNAKFPKDRDFMFSSLCQSVSYQRSRYNTRDANV